MKKGYVVALVVVALVVVVGVVSFRMLKKEEKVEKPEDKVQEEKEPVKEFNETEKHIIDLVNNKIKILEYFDQDNLEEFKITDIWGDGYYASSDNIWYLQVNYEFKCKDGTIKCNHVRKFLSEDDSLYAFLVKIDLNDRNFIEKINGLSIPFESDWVSTSEVPEYNN